MTITNGYVTLEELYAYETIDSDDPSDDLVLEDLIEQASRVIDGHCKRRFWAAAETRYFMAMQPGVLFTGDLLSVTSLKTDQTGDRVYENTWANTDYDLEPYNAPYETPPGPYLRISTAPIGHYTFPVRIARGVEIVGSWGYAATVPDDVKTACMIVVTDAMLKREHKENERGSMSSSGVIITAEGIPSRVWEILRPYRRARV
jgi:hypothetical protein